MPMPIPSGSLLHEVDVFSDLQSSSHPGSSSSSSVFINSPQRDVHSIWTPSSSGCSRSNASSRPQSLTGPSEGTVYGKGKGKAADLPPCLPPLAFSRPEFSYSHIAWPTSSVTDSVEPSSYGSPRFDSPNSPSPSFSFDATNFPNPTQSNPSHNPTHVRRRALSISSIHSTSSVSTLSLSKLRNKAFSGTPGNLARKLLRKPGVPATDNGSLEVPFQSDHHILDEQCKDVPPAYTITSNDGSQSLSWPLPPPTLKGKLRSNSSPSSFSILDLATASSTDHFTPLSLIIPSYFEALPRELRLRVLLAFLDVHEEEYEKDLMDGQWSVMKASSSKNKWVGRNRGMRELVKLSRVSKSWQMLLSDGQLWRTLDLRSFYNVPKTLILRLTSVAGPFITSLNFAGHVFLLSTTLTDVADHLCVQLTSSNGVPFTQLTALNFRGCTMLTTQSLHYLLKVSPALEKLDVKGLHIVTNTTCEMLAASCPQLTVLNMSRCPSMDADGIYCLCQTAISRKRTLLIRVLRLSGLKYVDDKMMAVVGKACPDLEVLDLSYCRQLHNSALEAFVACGEDEILGVETVVLNACQVGRDAGDNNKYRRRITQLRHISLSFCFLLTDIACSNLAHSVPRLEFLELAGIGDDLGDEGLIRLLNTTPMIRRLDLEDTAQITDAVISAITPSVNAEDEAVRDEREAGHALEHLVISYASSITDDALLTLIRACTRLKVLEADNTRIGPRVFKEFIRLSRRREVSDSRIVAVDCRTIGEHAVKEMASMTRPRLGWRAYDSRKLKYLDGRDGDLEDLKVGQDECDDKRVVVKTFYSWQTVDSVRTSREKRRKSGSRRAMNGSGCSSDDADNIGHTTRWWSPGGRRSGANSPTDVGRDTCRIM
ncbi:RNI-like protein [Guyanagaster necrorhizus]|uniref:RNI-like protein n=1 Tax=Guyanagaster necrorhizus TaxID=856835 RepID=A0A9P8AY28_9AGAR|nr:RNI-like protein [Guyanagaster necrorhizus MCA 3950]KAG7452193.1 RNI-like protein [Guyanagaster necrorhizus MCA 3950]